MAKFNRGHAIAARGVIQTTEQKTKTYEGGDAWVREPRSDLFLLAVSNMVGEDTFYEKASDRDTRFRNLVRQCAVQHPDWTAQFIKWLRSDGLMRSASVVAAAEYVYARRDEQGTGRTGHQYPAPTIPARSVVRDALQRPDEPGELLAYWTARYGMALPKPLKRGIADAMIRMGTERNYLKYGDAPHPGFSWRRVLDLTHPGDRDGSMQALKGDWQHELFRYVVTAPHVPGLALPESLTAIQARKDLAALAPTDRHAFMRRVQAGDEGASEKFRLAMAGQWEWAKSWLG